MLRGRLEMFEYGLLVPESALHRSQTVELTGKCRETVTRNGKV